MFFHTGRFKEKQWLFREGVYVVRIYFLFGSISQLLGYEGVRRNAKTKI